MPSGDRKRGRLLCLPSCFSASSVQDSEDFDFPPPADEPPPHHACRISGKSVPPTKNAAADAPKGPQSDLSQDIINCEKESKSAGTTTTQAQQPKFCHVSSKRNSMSPTLARIHRVDPMFPLQHATHSRRPNRVTGLTQSLIRAVRLPNEVAGLLTLATTLTVMLFFGRLCAVLCNCAWFYLLSCLRRHPPSSRPPPPIEIDGGDAADVNSPEYKKKVVLMGFLERNRGSFLRLPMTPTASPARHARLR